MLFLFNQGLITTSLIVWLGAWSIEWLNLLEAGACEQFPAVTVLPSQMYESLIKASNM